MLESLRPDTSRSSDRFLVEATRAGRVALAWAMAGGVLAGGLLVTSVTLAGRMSSSIAISSSTILFLLGAGAGFVHGGLLGYLGRGLQCPGSDCLRGLAVAALLAVPAGAAAWLLSMYVSLTAASIATGDVALMVPVIAAWIGCSILFAWAAWEGWRALRNTFRRWPEYRVGTAFLLLILAALLISFLAERPEIWFTDIQLSGAGAVLLAFGATVWIAVPVVVVLMHLLHQGVRWLSGPSRST